jgi:hypothetical protein
MSKFKHYRIEEDTVTFLLENKIHKMIIDGWIPAGGISISGNSFYQAMWIPPRIPELDKKIKAVFESEPKK